MNKFYSILSTFALCGVLLGCLTLAVDAQVFRDIQFQPYPVGKDIDLWMLEAKKFVRSPVILSPDRTKYAYTEVIFMPDRRQTFSKLYMVPVITPKPPPPVLPTETEVGNVPTMEPKLILAPYDPDKTLKLRQEILGVGHDKPQSFSFRTLTVVDWSASGSRLLFKQRVGTLHIGLKTSDILLYDLAKGTNTIYPELKRIVRYYWLSHSNLPDLDTVAWDIYPLGWKAGSDTEIYFKAWAYDNKNRKFLGVWLYDVDHERSQLVSTDEIDPPVGVNGWTVDLKEAEKQLTPPENPPWYKFWK